MANQNRSQLQATSQSNFPDNTSQLISPADLRQWITNGIDSFITQKDKSTLENAIYEAEGSALAASSTVDLSSATGNFLHITGAATISSFGTVTAGARFVLVFDGVCTLTYNATSLILPGTANITTAANDCCMIVSEGSGNWRVVGYFPIAGGGGGGTVTAVTATAPLASSGGSAPDISIPQANGTTDGFLDSADWTTFNGKQDVLSAGTGISIASNTVTNTAPDQVVALTAGTGIGITGTYPNFTIDNTSPGTMPGGADTEIQYNNGGTAFGGVSDLTWDDINNVLTIKNPRIGESVGNGHFHMHTINASPPSGLVDYITFWVDKSPKQVGFRFEQDTYTSAFQFNATSDLIYTFPDLSGTVALLANPASFSSLTSTSSVTIGDASATTGTIVLHNATNANTLTLQSGTTSSSYTITMPPAASVGAQYLQSTGSGGTLQWTSGTTTGVSGIGTINSATKSANGAVVTGSNLIMQTADASFPGLVSTGTQTFIGSKTFILAGSQTVPQITINNTGGLAYQWMQFTNGTPAAPASASSRSTGTKIVLHSVGTINFDNAIGVEGTSSNIVTWISSPLQIRFYPRSSASSVGEFDGGGSVIGLNLNATTTISGNVITGLPQLLMGGTNAQWISFGNANAAAQTTGTSIGTKVRMIRSSAGGFHECSIGIEGGTTNCVTWFSSTLDFKFYNGSNANAIATISTNAVLDLASANGRLRINGTQVVSVRDTGYTAFTGTTNKATSYATGTVTLIQLAERVAAIQASLTTHGLIGA